MMNARQHCPCGAAVPPGFRWCDACVATMPINLKQRVVQTIQRGGDIPTETRREITEEVNLHCRTRRAALN